MILGEAERLKQLAFDLWIPRLAKEVIALAVLEAGGNDPLAVAACCWLIGGDGLEFWADLAGIDPCWLRRWVMAGRPSLEGRKRSDASSAWWVGMNTALKTWEQRQAEKSGCPRSERSGSADRFDRQSSPGDRASINYIEKRG